MITKISNQSACTFIYSLLLLNFYHFLTVVLLFQGVGQYSRSIKQVEEDIQNGLKKVNELAGKNYKSDVLFL